MLAATAIAHASVGEVCSVATHAGATGAERGFDGTSTPAAIFGALFIQGVVQVFTAQSEQAKQSMAMVTVWLVTCLFYLRQWLAPPCALAVRWEHGGGLVPTQYALWSTSMSGQVVTLHALERREAAKRSPASAAEAGTSPGVAGGAQRQCCAALLCVQSMLWCGATADALLSAPLALTASLLAASFASFYLLLHCGIRAPLAACRRHAADTATGKRLRGVQTYLLTTWHAFPLVWLLDNSGALGASLTRDAYLASDVAAKLLPISLYLAVASR